MTVEVDVRGRRCISMAPNGLARDRRAAATLVLVECLLALTVLVGTVPNDSHTMD